MILLIIESVYLVKMRSTVVINQYISTTAVLAGIILPVDTSNYLLGQLSAHTDIVQIKSYIPSPYTGALCYSQLFFFSFSNCRIVGMFEIYLPPIQVFVYSLSSLVCTDDYSETHYTHHPYLKLQQVLIHSHQVKG